MKLPKFQGLPSQLPCNSSINRRRLIHKRRWLFTTILALCTIAGILYLTWLSIVAALINRLSPPPLQSNGVRRLLSTWKTPDDSAPSSAWLENFSAGIEPVACHSHNDYWTSVPLFAALSAGCISVEADIWLSDSDDADSSTAASVLVGHDKKSLTADYTLRSLYISPLHAILDYQNTANGANATGWHGVFDVQPRMTLVLLLDFKTGGKDAWTAMQRELQPLREAGWLTYWDRNAATRVQGPVTVVVTGEVTLNMLIQEGTQDVFYDSPLTELESGKYTAANSYYASANMKEAVGKVQWRMNDEQLDALQEQIQAAKARDLVSRYWGTPDWPVTVRNRVWEDLAKSGVGVLNVDELSTATRWDWRFCTVLGLTICK